MANITSASLLTFTILHSITISRTATTYIPAGIVVDALGAPATSSAVAIGINRFNTYDPANPSGTARNTQIYPAIAAQAYTAGARVTQGGNVYQARYSFTSTGTDQADTTKWLPVPLTNQTRTAITDNYSTNTLPTKDLAVVTDGIYPCIVTVGQAITAGQPVAIGATAGTIKPAASGDKVFGIALDSCTAAASGVNTFVRVSISKSVL